MEDYVPERLDYQLKPGVEFATAGEPIPVALDARFLYGAPAAGLDVTGAIRLKAVDGAELPGHPGFVAGLVDEEFNPVEVQFPDKAQTDDKGHADLSIELPEGDAIRPLEARIIVDVAESGGRTVERVVTLPVRGKAVMLGIKKDFSGDISSGDLASFEAIAVAPDGGALARKNVTWSLYKVDNDYQWFNVDGRWNFEPVKSSRKLADGAFDISSDASAKFSARVGWGKHRLDVKSPEGETTSFTFDVGWSGSASADTPDNVAVTLDKSNYAPGETAQLRIASRFAGKATIALVGDKLERLIDIDLKQGDNVAPFEVGADWGAGAYAVAITQRPLDVKQKRMPARAMGVAWLHIDEAARKLDVAIAAPDKTRPRATVRVPIQLAGLAAGEEARVTVAAVDIGILNLTHYQTPNPSGYFFGQRKLALEIRDLYGFLIDGMQGVVGALACRRRRRGQSGRRSADAGAARVVLRRRQSRRRRPRRNSLRSAGLQRRRAHHRGRLDRRARRRGQRRHDRPRSGRRHREPAALPQHRRSLALAVRHRQRRWRSRRVQALARHSRTPGGCRRCAEPDAQARRPCEGQGDDADRGERRRDGQA